MSTKVFSEIYTDFVEMLHRGLHSSIARNVVALYIIQFANYIIPLITIPYLVRVLKPAGYGAVAFAQGFINYPMLFVGGILREDGYR